MSVCVYSFSFTAIGFNVETVTYNNLKFQGVSSALCVHLCYTNTIVDSARDFAVSCHHCTGQCMSFW